MTAATPTSPSWTPRCSWLRDPDRHVRADYTIADDCGNSIQHTQFDLTDNEAPTLSITCPARTIESDGYCEHDGSAANTGTPSHIEVTVVTTM